MTGKAAVRGNFAKRLQNKRALMHARVRQGEVGVVALQIVI